MLDLKYLRIRSLNVKGWVVVRQPFPKLVTTKHTMDPRLPNVLGPGLGIVVEHVGDSAEA